MHTNIGVALKTNHSSTLRMITFHNKSANTFAFYIFSLKFCLHPYMLC